MTTWDVPSEHDAPSVPSTVTRLHPLFGPPCTVGSTPLWARGTCEIQSLAWSHGLCPAGLPQRHALPVCTGRRGCRIDTVEARGFYEHGQQT